LKRTAPAKRKYNFNYIKEAYRSFKKGNYSNSAIILEKASGAGIDEPYLVFLLALSCLYCGDYAKAENVLLKIEREDPFYPPYIQLKSFLALKSALSPEEAISSYISSLEKIPSDKMLKKALVKIEKTSDFYKLQKSAKITSFVEIPAPGKGVFSYFKSAAGGLLTGKGTGRERPLNSGLRPILLLLIVIFISAAALVYFYFDEIDGLVFKDQDSSRVIAGTDKIDIINLSGSGYGLINKVNRDVTPEFYVSGDQLHKDFETARNLIKKGELNRAIIILNRIINSNSSYMVKEKVEFLIRFILESDERKYESIEYKEIMAKPYLYRGVSLTLKGRSANVKQTAKGTGFSLLIGFDGKKFEGALDAFYKEKVNIKDGDDLEAAGIFYPHIGENKRHFVSIETLTVK